MRLFVANPTSQNINFTYRLPDSRAAKMQPIMMGSQEQIGGSLSQAEIDLIVEQNAKYGLIHFSEVGKRGAPTPTMVYSVDREVSLSKIYEAMKVNADALEERGRISRQQAALGMQQIVDETVAPTRALNVEVIEEESRAGDRSGPRMSEKLIAAKDEQTAAAAAAKEPARGRRQR